MYRWVIYPVFALCTRSRGLWSLSEPNDRIVSRLMGFTPASEPHRHDGVKERAEIRGRIHPLVWVSGVRIFSLLFQPAFPTGSERMMDIWRLCGAIRLPVASYFIKSFEYVWDNVTGKQMALSNVVWIIVYIVYFSYYAWCCKNAQHQGSLWAVIRFILTKNDYKWVFLDNPLSFILDTIQLNCVEGKQRDIQNNYAHPLLWPDI